MAVKYRIIDDVAVIKVKGNLIGGDETKEVHEQVQAIVSAGIKKVVLDLNKVKWMNSHGVGIFMACYSTVQGVKGKMNLCRVSKKVMFLLDLTKVITLFDSFDSIRQAVKAFK